MVRLIAYLRSLGSLGTLAANILAFLTTNWVTTMSVATGLIGASWASAVSFFHEPAVETGMAISLATLWTMVAILYLYDRTRPRLVRPAPDYRYGLTFEGINPNVDTLSDDSWLTFGVQIRNFSQAPIKYTVKSFDFRIGTRALPKSAKTFTGYLPRGSGKTIWPSKFQKDEVREFFGKRMNGTADIEIVYGHPEEDPVRRLRIGLEITLHLPMEEGQPAGWGTNIVSEEDEPIDATSNR